MSYLGQVELKSSEIRRVDVTGSTSATHTLTWTPASEQSLIITINGIKQQNNYSISGTTLTLDDALLSDDKMEVIGILDIGEAVIPPDDSITTAMVKDDAIDADKLANSINTEIAANTAKVTNATHTGDVTGATALTIATDAVDIAMLSATGTADSTTFLRGDNAWASAGGGITHASIWDMNTTFQGTADPITTNWVESNTVYGYSSLGASMTQSSGVFTFPATGYWLLIWQAGFQIDSEDSRNNTVRINTTTDDSNYYNASRGRSALYDSGDWTYQSAIATWLFDVTNVSTHKCKFGAVVTNSNTYVTQSMNNGVSDAHGTMVTFIRLADT